MLKGEPTVEMLKDPEKASHSPGDGRFPRSVQRNFRAQETWV